MKSRLAHTAHKRSPVFSGLLIGILLLLGMVATAGAIETHIGTIRLSGEVLCLDHCNDYYLEPDTGTTQWFIRGADLPLFLNRRVQIYGNRLYCGGCVVINVTNILRLTVTSVDLVEGTQPFQTALLQNYPNPFNPATEISFQTDRTGQVLLKVYDLLGREVATLVDGMITPGTFKVRWDASDLPSGVYYYRLITATTVLTRKMILAR